MGVERRRHADEQRVRLVEPLEIGCRMEASGVHRGADVGVRNVPQIALAAREAFGLFFIHIETEHAQAGLRGGKADRQPDIAEANDPQKADAGLELGRQFTRVAPASHSGPPRNSDDPPTSSFASLPFRR